MTGAEPNTANQQLTPDPITNLNDSKHSELNVTQSSTDSEENSEDLSGRQEAAGPYMNSLRTERDTTPQANLSRQKTTNPGARVEDDVNATDSDESLALAFMVQHGLITEEERMDHENFRTMIELCEKSGMYKEFIIRILCSVLLKKNPLCVHLICLEAANKWTKEALNSQRWGVKFLEPEDKDIDSLPEYKKEMIDNFVKDIEMYVDFANALATTFLERHEKVLESIKKVEDEQWRKRYIDRYNMAWATAHKFLGDFNRYHAEIRYGDRRMELAYKSQEHYIKCSEGYERIEGGEKTAYCLSSKLNHCVLLFDIIGDHIGATTKANQVLENAQKTLTAADYRSTYRLIILQLIKENVTQWECQVLEMQENKDKEDGIKEINKITEKISDMSSSRKNG